MSNLIKSKIQSRSLKNEAATTLQALINENFDVSEQSTIIIRTEENKPLSQKAKDFINKLKSFKNLQENWDSYGAEKPSLRAIENAISFVRFVNENDLSLYFTAPGPDGEILIEIGDAHQTTEVFFNPDGLNEFTVYEGERIITEERLENNFANFLNVQFA